jgi:hypothetical protein
VSVTGEEEIIHALAGYGQAAAGNVVNAVAQEDYVAFRDRLKRAIAGRRRAEAALDSPDPDPAVLRERLGRDLTDSGADDDTEILAAGRRLLAALGGGSLTITNSYGPAAVAMTGPVTVNYGGSLPPSRPGAE